MAEELNGEAVDSRVNDVELNAKVAEGLAAAFSGADDVDDSTEVVDESTPTETVETDESTAEVASEDAATLEDGTEAEEAAEEVSEPVVKTAVTPATTLPAAYVRSLKALEWTDEEIAEASKVPNFITTAAKLHASRNKQVSEWAEAGRKARQPAATTDASQTQSQVAPSVMAPIDAKALKAQYGDDKLIDVLVGPVNKMIERINGMLPQVEQTQKRAHQAELEMLGQQIDTFFKSPELKPYAKHYETPEAKNKVLETADALIAGARLQHRNLSLGEALQLAHDSASGAVKTETVRSGIKKQLKTRAQGFTLKPTARGTTANATASKIDSRAKLERKVGLGLRSVFSGS